ncbi:ntrilase and fragile histidine triad fusion protein NitFhit [Dermatophagoides pteronyssinus]|uniref:ntrilase and fragile histidine triad fusion protein NitFhit n=1 Tax=Dermatophagoides pteronyssinus TaxID=6956 RepID=UPI003F681F84
MFVGSYFTNYRFNRKILQLSSSLVKQRNHFSMDSNNNKKTKIAVIQLTSKQNKDENYQIAEKLIKSARDDGARMAFLPECFDMICPSKKLTMENGEPINGPTVQRYQNLAKNLNIWLSLGGLHEKVVPESNDDKRLFNAHIIVDQDGQIVSIYRKVHLFNLDIPGTRLVESEFSRPGNAVIKPPQTPCGRLGMGICYDVRFPEFAISLAKSGADILSYPSSFTIPTGKAHWEILLRSRAIETQCYVVAAAQVGAHNEKRKSYGHAMIIDPWGKILTEINDEKPGYAVAEIDFDYLKEIRQRLPVWSDRKPELYGYIRPTYSESMNDLVTKSEQQQQQSHLDLEDFRFGPDAIVKTYQIFAKTFYSIAFINHRPVLPGHVLVSPLRPDSKRLSELNNDELFDLFQLVQKVQKAIELIYNAEASTVAIQDGKDAGQSVQHLHVHVIPRKQTDFGGNIDQIYQHLQQHDKQDNPLNLCLLTNDEMKKQCNILRNYF